MAKKKKLRLSDDKVPYHDGTYEEPSAIQTVYYADEDPKDSYPINEAYKLDAAGDFAREDTLNGVRLASRGDMLKHRTLAEALRNVKMARTPSLWQGRRR